MLNASECKTARSLRLQLDKQLYKLLSARLLAIHKIQVIEAVAAQIIVRAPKGFGIKLEPSNTV